MEMQGTRQLPVSREQAWDAQGGVAGFGKGESNVSLTPNDPGCDFFSLS